MRVQDVMTEKVQTISPTAAADDAWELMRRRGIHQLVVMERSSVMGYCPTVTPADGWVPR